MKQNSYVVAFRRYDCSDVEYIELYATSAQEAVDRVRYELVNPYQVTDCYKAIKNWN